MRRVGSSDQHDSAGEKPRRQPPRLAIIETIVEPRGGWASEHLGGDEHIDAALLQGSRTLFRVETDPHCNKLYPQ
jgi:hypothetical protein